MGKMKTKKTLVKRIKVTKGGKLLRKRVRTSHLKSKWSTSRRHRKSAGSTVANTGHKRIFQKLLNKRAKGLN